jgi:hypothetical protein
MAMAAGKVCMAEPTLPACVQMEKDLPVAICIMWSYALVTLIVCAIIKYTEWRAGRRR